MSEERLTWVQIQEKYPHMYVGLDDVELVEDGNGVKSGIVKWAGKTPPNCKVIDWGTFCYSAEPPKEWVFYTTLDEDHPLGYLNPNIKRSGGERLTWQEIVNRYPHQYVGLVELEFGINSAGIRSAVVKCTDKDTDDGEMLRDAYLGKLRMKYTTMDEDYPIIWPQEWGASPIDGDDSNA